MKKTVKCYRCGTEYEIPFKDNEEIFCPHCHGLMQQDKKSKRILMFAKTLIYLLITIIAVVIGKSFNMTLDAMQNFLLIGILILVFLGAFYISNHLGEFIVSRLGLLTYIHIPDKSDEKREKKKSKA